MSRLPIKYKCQLPAVVEGPWLRIPETWVDEDTLKRDLEIPNDAFWQAYQTGGSLDGQEPYVKLWRKKNGYFYVPRHYAPPYTRKHGGVFRDRPPVIFNEDITHTIVPRGPIQKAASLALRSDRKDKILALSCGVGKTVCSLHASVEGRRSPTLVVVNTNSLMDQWRARIEEFIRVNGRPPKVGHIQGSQRNWEGCDFAVAMLHTLVGQKFPKEFFDYWALVIFDETHRLGAKLFSKACPLFPGERWGLTATLKRKDGMEKVIQYHLGEVAYEYLDQPLKPIIYFVETNEIYDDRKFRLWGGRGRVSIAKLMNKVCGSHTRNELISKWISKAVGQGRTLLILGERLNQLQELYDMCDCPSKSVHVGSMSQEERKEALTKQVVFATQHLAKEGLDRPEFDTLFILFPFSGEGRFRQSTGRILRIADGKKQPKVLVFTDNSQVIRSMTSKMRRNAFRLDFKVKTVKA